MPPPSIWSAELVGELRQAWDDGLTTREIAERMGRGITRNAVIGKAYRLRLERRMPPQPRPKPTVPRPRLVVVKPAKPRTPAVPLAPPPPPTPPPPTPRPLPLPTAPPRMRRLQLVDLAAHHCRWIEGDTHSQFYFCAADRDSGCAYCPHHQMRAYARTAQR
jgi:GcrA cell cycle regulator